MLDEAAQELDLEAREVEPHAAEGRREAGLYDAAPEYAGIYLHARYFDPRLGTFLSADPIGVAGGMNLFGYAFGNPVGFSDRAGLLADANGCDGGAGVPYIVDGMWYFPAGVGCPGGGGGGGAWSWMPGYAPSTGAVVSFPGSTYPPDDGYGGHGTPVCRPGDPNCAKTECKPGDPNCDKTTCKPGDPGCEEQPPTCQPGDPTCVDPPADPRERPKTPLAVQRPLPFSDPCTTSFGGRWLESFMYLNHSLVGMGVEALHLGELALEVGGAVTAAAYLSSAVRHGATPVALVYGGVLGEEGALAVAGHKLGKASPWLLTVPAGFALAATYDAATANVGCR